MLIAESLSFQLVNKVMMHMKFSAEKKINLMIKVNYKPFLIKFIKEEEWEKKVKMEKMKKKREWEK